MSMARLVVAAVVVEGRSKSEVARDYGVSRRWVVTLVQRFLAEGEAGLEARSRRPKRSPRQVDAEVDNEIVRLRKQLTEAGHDAGPHTIAFHLQRQLGASPPVSTIWRVLTRRGFIVAEPHKRPRSSYVRFEADQPNERWQLDITHWRLAEGPGVEILNIVDDHSRIAIGADARTVFKAADVVTSFRKATAVWGVPAGMLSDNGAVFTGACRGAGRVALEAELLELGVEFRHSRPYHPQTCGKVERFHQTLKNWLTTRPPAPTIRALQAQLDTFVAYYNHQRPHRALGRRTPAEAYAARPKASPAPAAIIDPHFRVRLHQRRHQPPPQQPPAPHRRRPPPRRRTRPRPGPRPRDPNPDRTRRTPPRAHPRPRLPTRQKTVNDVARHPCTMSRDITWWRRWESNPRPPACKAGALPTELRPRARPRRQRRRGVIGCRW
jgi:transposase InsO family protein